MYITVYGSSAVPTVVTNGNFAKSTSTLYSIIRDMS